MIVFTRGLISSLSFLTLLIYLQQKDMFYSMLRNLLVAAFHGSLYTDLSPGAIQSRLSLLFFAIMFVMMANQSFIPKYVYLFSLSPT